MTRARPRKTAFLAHVLDVDAPLVVFDWPGDQGSTRRGYRRAQRIARESAEAAWALELVEPGSDRVTLVDVTPVNRTRNFHNFSLETPEFFDDVYLRLINPETPKSRLQYRVRSESGAEYWVLTRGR